MYAQTSIQLFGQLRREGYAPDELVRVRQAYELAICLFSGQYRPSGKSFIAHLVGTGSVLGSLHVPVRVVAAGLVHAAYFEGDFGSLAKGVSDAKREHVRRAVGDDVERLVYRYAMKKRLKRRMPASVENMDTLDESDRDVLLMYLADKLDVHSDLGVLYESNVAARKKAVREVGPLMEAMAERLGAPVLASELRRVFHETLVAEIPEELRGEGRDSSFVVVPKSYRTKFSVALYRQCVGRLRRSRSLIRAVRPVVGLVRRSFNPGS